MIIRTLLHSILLFALCINLQGQGTLVNKSYERGIIKSGYKIGSWQYFDSTGTLVLGIDYSNSVLNYLKPDTSEYVIYKNGEWIKSELDIYPRFIGSYVEFYTILNENVDYPMQARYRDLVGKVYVQFEVDTLGKATNFEVIRDIGGECGYEFTRVLKLIPNYWLVAEKDGQKYRSRYVISCEFAIIMDGRKLKERQRRKKKKAETFKMPLARELKGISYTIKKGYNPE